MLVFFKAAQTLDVRDANSPNQRRLSTSLSTDSESGEEGHTRRYTPPARTIPRFRKYNVDDYQFLKVLGKGSFGKVSLYISKFHPKFGSGMNFCVDSFVY